MPRSKPRPYAGPGIPGHLEPALCVDPDPNSQLRAIARLEAVVVYLDRFRPGSPPIRGDGHQDIAHGIVGVLELVEL